VTTKWRFLKVFFVLCCYCKKITKAASRNRAVFIMSNLSLAWVFPKQSALRCWQGYKIKKDKRRICFVNNFSDYETLLPEFVQEADLREMMRFIKGEGKYRFMDIGIHTYPGTIQQKYCEELEVRGLIYRQIDEKDYVIWMPKKVEESGNDG
jgi:hypothetical protein